MPAVSLPLTLGGYEGNESSSNAQRLINLYPEIVKGEDKVQVRLVKTSGLDLQDTVGIGPHRGSIVFSGNSYFVSRNELYKRDTSGTKTLIGTLNTTSGLVSMAHNGQEGGQLMIVDGTDGYIYDSSTLTAISDPQFPANPSHVIFVDGYFLVLDADTADFYLSSAYDGTAYSSLDTARAERDSDNLVTAHTLGRTVWLFGERTTEVWFNSGDTFPFDPVQNGFIEIGILAKQSLAKLKETMIWLANTEKGYGQVVVSEGLSYKSVTPQQITSKWRTYSDLTNAEAFGYEENGHYFYQITFPSDDATWVYDLTTEQWHEKKYGESTRHRARTHIFFNQEHIVGDFLDGNIYKLDPDTYTDNGEEIRCSVVTYHVSENRQRVRHNSLYLDSETGVGLTSGQGSDPLIGMSYSDNTGKTYGNTRYISFGKLGEYSKEIKWGLLGSSKDRIYKFTYSEPTKFVINKLVLDVDATVED